jgi:hypothetical protein
MKNNWRPVGWERHFVPEDRRFAFEFGADAMLEGLGKMGNRIQLYTDDDRGSSKLPGTWVLLFIPDEENK